MTTNIHLHLQQSIFQSITQRPTLRVHKSLTCCAPCSHNVTTQQNLHLQESVVPLHYTASDVARSQITYVLRAMQSQCDNQHTNLHLQESVFPVHNTTSDIARSQITYGLRAMHFQQSQCDNQHKFTFATVSFPLHNTTSNIARSQITYGLRAMQFQQSQCEKQHKLTFATVSFSSP